MKEKKFKSVSVNNRKKQILIEYSSGKKLTLHFGQLGIQKNIVRAWIDPETRKQTIGFEFTDGRTDFMPYDQPLAVTKDPGFLLQSHIEMLTSRIKEELQKRKISKRYVAEQLHTSDNQLQRLLNPTILNKNWEQLYAIASLLHLRFEIRFRKAA